MIAADTHRLGLDAHGSVQSLTSGWTYLVGQYPDHAISSAGPVRALVANVDNAFLNMVVIEQPTGGPRGFADALAQAAGIMERCPYPAMLASVPEWYPDGADALFASAGLAHAQDLWGMAATTLALARWPEPELDYRLIRDRQSAIDIGLVNAAAYSMPVETFAITDTVHQWSGEHFGVVGYADGEAVTGALAYIQDDQIYIGWVATLPDRHGQGLGEAAMRRAIKAAQDAASGPLPLWLHATAMGRPLYRSMGFEDAAHMRLHVLEGAGH
ncbi:GNAT family N-acetyltransferase [Erythrobacter dokdonensis]|uniref:Acetyltransferase, GNAT family n=1 Tax=Erythrobacter dokdonensis DSW-74 TaxID=1300349 RepID=A0A1A7BFG9_9SPHN|nr:GNAT family N-acetyltransferase [Erythrobacter dokdonensis]OBV10491.1 Acetyltransferase, GNAT family [Erythrobacter dokdonensis DSW-74]